MTSIDWNSSHPEVLLEFAARFLHAQELRQFACACCVRVEHVIDDSRARRLISFAEQRSTWQVTVSELEAMRSEASVLYNAAYPGYGAPSPKALAIAAIGEAAFTEAANIAAMNASKFAADAVGSAAGLTVENERYDAAYSVAFDEERASQAALFRKMFGKLKPEIVK